MRKTLQLCTLLLAALCMISCGGDNGVDNKPNTPENPENPNNPEQPAVTPEISVTEVELTFDSYTFEVTSNVEGELGYVYVKDGFDVPQFQDWFAHHSEQIKDKVTIKISDLNDDTTYKLCVVLRSSKDGVLSAPKMITFTTPDDGVKNPITIDNATYDTITFTINLTGRYIFMVVSQADLDYYNQTAEAYLKMFNVIGNDPYTYEWIDGGSYQGTYNMLVKPDREYYVVAAQCDSQNNIIGDIYEATCKTPKKPASTASVTSEFTEITSTSVKIKTTIGSGVAQYYVYVRDKAWADGIISGYGESILQTLVKSPSAGSWVLTTDNEQEWGGLVPNTAYYCHLLVVDNVGGETLSLIDFTTSAASSTAPEVDLTITAPTEDSHESLNLNIFSSTAASVKYVFRPTADIANKRDMGYSDAKIVVDNGIDLSGNDVAAVASTGLSILQPDLWPNTEYTAIVSVKNDEQLETIKSVKFNTSKRPVPARVESELFTSLLGEWEVSYDFVDYNFTNQRIEGKVVTIAQGIDATTKTEYREQNQLVVLGWPFQTSDFIEGGYTYFDINDLTSANSYWKDYPSLAYRDYGPKIFLEIGAGDVVTIPTSRSTYIYNDAPVGGYTLYFFGCHYNEGAESYTAPATFPVTVSADGNTITIGAHHSGSEFGFGIYRPAVFRENEAWAIATGDIVMKRVK